MLEITIKNYPLCQRILKARMQAILKARIQATSVQTHPLAPIADEWWKYEYASWCLEDFNQILENERLRRIRLMFSARQRGLI
jgi:hypothetical protein